MAQEFNRQWIGSEISSTYVEKASGFKCEFCGRSRNISLLEHRANRVCNACFDERADLFNQKNEIGTNELAA